MWIQSLRQRSGDVNLRIADGVDSGHQNVRVSRWRVIAWRVSCRRAATTEYGLPASTSARFPAPVADCWVPPPFQTNVPSFTGAHHTRVQDTSRVLQRPELNGARGRMGVSLTASESSASRCYQGVISRPTACNTLLMSDLERGLQRRYPGARTLEPAAWIRPAGVSRYVEAQVRFLSCALGAFPPANPAPGSRPCRKPRNDCS
jgi:hypothetical protein